MESYEATKAEHAAAVEQLKAELAEKAALAAATEAAYLANLETGRETIERLHLRIADLESLLPTDPADAPGDSEEDEDPTPSDDEEDE